MIHQACRSNILPVRGWPVFGLALLLLFAGAIGRSARRKASRRRATSGSVASTVDTIRGSKRTNPSCCPAWRPGRHQSAFRVDVCPPRARVYGRSVGPARRWQDTEPGGFHSEHVIGTAQSDGIELTEYLKRGKTAFPRNHPGGTFVGLFLGIRIVKQLPRPVRGFVGTGQVVSWKGTIETLYRITLGEHEPSRIQRR